MKKSLFVLCAVMLNMQVNAADLLGSMKKATAKVEEAQTKAEETKASAKDAVTSPDQAALALVKAKLKTGSTKEQVRKELGEPAETAGSGESEVWLYDVNAINSSLGDKAVLAQAVGVKVPGADKRVAISFKSDKVHNLKIAAE